MRRSEGFTLIEVLVALLVLAIGLLGLAGLQTFGLQANHSASLRTQATLLSYDISDRMRANRAAYVSGGSYTNPPSGTTTQNCDWHGSDPDECTPSELAQFDLARWRAALAGQLPGGAGVVCLDASPEDGGDANSNGAVEATEFACSNTGQIYAIKVWWIEKNESTGAPLFKRFVTTFQP